MQFLRISSKSVALFIYSYIYENFRIIDVSIDSLWVWIFAFIAQDFAYYCGHRAVHGKFFY